MKFEILKFGFFFFSREYILNTLNIRGIFMILNCCHFAHSQDIWGHKSLFSKKKKKVMLIFLRNKRHWSRNIWRTCQVETTEKHKARVMEGKLTVTLAQNESQSTTLCIIFMLMRATRQFFTLRGKTQAFFVLFFCLSHCKTHPAQYFCVCLCKLTKKLFSYHSHLRDGSALRFW